MSTTNCTGHAPIPRLKNAQDLATDLMGTETWNDWCSGKIRTTELEWLVAEFIRAAQRQAIEAAAARAEEIRHGCHAECCKNLDLAIRCIRTIAPEASRG